MVAMVAESAALGSFNDTARVMKFIASNAVHVNGAFSLA